MRFIAPDNALTATLSCATANASYPATNLITQLRSDTLRTTGVSAQVIRATWGVNQTIAAVALCRHNLTAAATWRVQLYSDDAWTTSIYDSGAGGVTALISTDPGAFDAVGDASFAVLRNSVMYFTQQTTVRSMQVTLTDAANPAGYLEAARLIAGAYVDLENPDWQYGPSWSDPTTQVRTLGGSLLSQNNGDRTRSFDLPFSLLVESTRNYLFDLARVYGMERDFFWSMWPGDAGRKEREHQGWMKITGMEGFKHTMPGYYGTSLTLGDC